MNNAEYQTMQTTAINLGVDPSWLFNLIQEESGWNPLAVNPYSSAKGLIQFVDSTAQGLGFADSQDLINKNPDITSQLTGPVYSYLAQYKPFQDQQDFYMAVFLPSYRNKPADTAFSADIQAENPGIATIQDYVDKVNGAGNSILVKGMQYLDNLTNGNPLIVLLIFAIIVFGLYAVYTRSL